MDAYLLGTAGSDTDPASGDRPFAWSPWTARRAIGVAAVRRCLEGGARSPAGAVRAVVSSMVDEARAGVARRGSPSRWLAEIGEGAQAAAIAEATTWATRLFVAVEWDRLGRPATVGAPDRWWDCPGVRVSLRGRADARIETPVGRPSLLTMLAGRPGPTSRFELALAALVDVAARPTAPPPARVVGWWPDCGRALVLEAELGLLEEAARAVVAAVDQAAPEHRPEATRAA